MYNTVPIDDEAGPFVKCGYKIHTIHNRVTLIREQFSQYESNYCDLVTGECFVHRLCVGYLRIQWTYLISNEF